MSQPIDPKLKAAGAAAFVGAVGLIAYGLLKPNPHADKARSHVPWAAAPRADKVRCMQQVGLALPLADGGHPFDLFGLMHDNKPGYAQVTVCAEMTEDGGTTEATPLPPEMIVIEDTQREVAYDGGAKVSAVLQGQPEFECACSSGSNCEAFVQTAYGEDGGWSKSPNGTTLSAGRWRGAGCVRKTCVEIAGFDSWMEDCPR